MEWVGHNTTCVVRFFSMGGDFDSMRRDARSRFRVRGSVVVGRSVDRWIVRVASSAHANRPRLKIARRDPEDGRSIGTDRTGSDRDARCEGDAKVLAEMNGRTDERSNERRSSSRRDATRRDTGRFRRPSSVVRSVPFRIIHRITTHHRFKTRRNRGRERFLASGVDLFFGRDLVCDFDESQFVKSVPPDSRDIVSDMVFDFPYPEAVGKKNCDPSHSIF
jgi:hypothetical protein